jgi:hypothetical protein
VTGISNAESLHWHGHWIGHQPRPATGTPADFLTGAESSREFSRCMFRRTFDVEVPPAEAAARISADSRYVLLGERPAWHLVGDLRLKAGFQVR